MKEHKEDNLEWVEVECDHLVKDEWIDFRRTKYRFPDGKEFEPFYSYSRRNYVVIVATDEEGNYICVRQFRYGLRRVTTEFCAGGIERLDGKNYAKPDESDAVEEPIVAAKRELLEETGYTSDEWSFSLKVPSNATMADNYAYVFRAKNCKKVSNQDLDDTEFLNVHLYSRGEVEELIHKGEFAQAVHVMGFYLPE